MGQLRAACTAGGAWSPAEQLGPEIIILGVSLQDKRERGDTHTTPRWTLRISRDEFLGLRGRGVNGTTKKEQRDDTIAKIRGARTRYHSAHTYPITIAQPATPISPLLLIHPSFISPPPEAPALDLGVGLGQLTKTLPSCLRDCGCPPGEWCTCGNVV